MAGNHQTRITTGAPAAPRTILAGIAVALLALSASAAHAASTDDEIFANAALRDLHTLAVASAQTARAAKDSDDIGCRDGNENVQKAAHEALLDMHRMSFAPIDAVDSVSSLLRTSRLLQNGCNNEFASGILLMVAGQAVTSLRYDYAIGDGDWYTFNANGKVEAENPLRYAQSLKDQNYSWVSGRPKGIVFIVVSDWKAEMASNAVADPSIKNSGNNLNAVEVDYRKTSDASNTEVYFYRTKEDAVVAMQVVRQRAENDAKADAEGKAADTEWNQKLTALPYMAANHNEGFKLIYAVCKSTGKNAKGENTCDDDDSHDWSDDRSTPYRWFSDMQGCEAAEFRLNTEHPTGVKFSGDDVLMSYCVPASKVSGHTLKGYEMAFSLSVPDAAADDALYANLRESGSQIATVFKTFHACYAAIDAAYSKTLKDLGADEDGNLLSEKTKSISLTATCVRVYSLSNSR